MAASTLPAPGSKFGPCLESCAHIDCADSRALAAMICRICRECIGYDRRFYLENKKPVHAACFEDESERKLRARRKRE